MGILSLFCKSRAFHIAVEHCILDILAKAPDPEAGVHIDDIGKETGLDSLGLCEPYFVYIISEIKPSMFVTYIQLACSALYAPSMCSMRLNPIIMLTTELAKH